MNGADRATGRRPRTPSAQVASELLNAAESVLVKDGMRGLTVRAVAAEAGVAPMSVYNHFGGKAGLLAALPLRCARPAGSGYRSRRGGGRAGTAAALLSAVPRVRARQPAALCHLVRRGCPR